MLDQVQWIQVSRSRSLLLMVKPTIFLLAIGMGVCLHLILFAFNAAAIRMLASISGGDQTVFAKKENSVAFILVSSQKTLLVMAAVVEQLGGAFGEPGLLILPCVAAHLNQIIIDSFIVNLWLRKGPSVENAKLL
ncbi:Sodium Bile acid symporter family [Euphorbia peplus]|nr:Sodium Bile acid symporter family [Euphorbia peplus]